MGIKSRDNFNTGLTKCFDTCKCIECRKETMRNKILAILLGVVCGCGILAMAYIPDYQRNEFVPYVNELTPEQNKKITELLLKED